MQTHAIPIDDYREDREYIYYIVFCEYLHQQLNETAIFHCGSGVENISLHSLSCPNTHNTEIYPWNYYEVDAFTAQSLWIEWY